MVKLQKILVYKYKTKTGETKNNYKYVLNIPQKIIDELGWNNGNELELLAVKVILIINNSIYIIIIRIVKISGGYRSVGLITTQNPVLVSLIIFTEILKINLLETQWSKSYNYNNYLIVFRYLGFWLVYHYFFI